MRQYWFSAVMEDGEKIRFIIPALNRDDAINMANALVMRNGAQAVFIPEDIDA